MTEDISAAEANEHVKKYLDDYLRLSCAPGFAILLKGQWGSGKTWFIEKYRENSLKNLKDKGCKYLYISLYGMSSISEIEDAFFQCLHPVLASRGAKITGTIIKGLLKGALKIDLNRDGSNDGSWNIQIPEIKLPEHLKNIDESILIFDDLERCNIDLGSLLGYINHFVEHQGIKVILVANEDELYKNEIYKSTKEKLIGKTFEIKSSFEDALKHFVSQVNDDKLKDFLSTHSKLIRNIYEKAEYYNLRNLNQVILDFQRIFKALLEDRKRNQEMLEDLLAVFVVFSIEIRRGLVLPKDISKLPEIYGKHIRKNSHSRDADESQESSTASNQEEKEKEKVIQEIISRYSSLEIHNPFPDAEWWQDFFDRGIVNKERLEELMLNSKYFQDENTPDWIKLWHFSDLDDDDFYRLLAKIEAEYKNRIFLDLGVVKHIFGLFLFFSEAKLYDKTKQEILKDAKEYIDDLKSNNNLELPPSVTSLYAVAERVSKRHMNLGFQGVELPEFQEFCHYIKESQASKTLEVMTESAQSLIQALSTDVSKFHWMICLDSVYHDESVLRYYNVPILKYVSPDEFIKNILNLKHEDRKYAFWSISERYKDDVMNGRLVEELDWLQNVRDLLLQEVDNRQGKLSGFLLNNLNSDCLKGAIEKLNIAKSQVQKNQ